MFTVLWNLLNCIIQVIKSNKTGISIFIITIYLLASCSPRISNNMLTFFFDGVPPYDSIKSSGGLSRINENDSSKIFRSGSIVENSGYTVHYPYKEKECSNCHDENNKSDLIMTMPALCYTCHDDFSKTYKYIHGPVSAGYCTACHNPHMSKEKKLLIRTGQQLCLFCHDLKAVMKNDEHKDIAGTECTLCHNPHGGENRFILN